MGANCQGLNVWGKLPEENFFGGNYPGENCLGAGGAIILGGIDRGQLTEEQLCRGQLSGGQLSGVQLSCSLWMYFRSSSMEN